MLIVRKANLSMLACMCWQKRFTRMLAKVIGSWIGNSGKVVDFDDGEVNFVDLGCGGGWFFNGEIFIPICIKY